MIKAILFDMDGVLAECVDIHYQAINKALGLFGYTINPEEHRLIYNGLPTTKKLEMLTENKGLPKSLHGPIANLKKKYTSDFVNKLCHPRHDKLIMLEELSKKYKLGCCSNAIKESINQILKRSGIDKYFNRVTGNDEGLSPKPAPDIYKHAMKCLSVTPEETVIIEDSIPGIKSAKASGATVIEVSNVSEVNSNLFIKHNLL